MLGVPLAVSVCDAVCVSVSLADCVCEPVSLVDGEPVALGVDVPERLSEGVNEGVMLCVSDGVTDADAVSVAEPLGVPVSLAV